MEDIREQLARRDRWRRHLAMKMTPEERMEAMARLQANAWKVLISHPAGYAHFMRRNLKTRAARTRAIREQQ